MATGQIKALVRGRGFGFIQPEDSRGYLFFHSSGLRDVLFAQLEEGLQVEFDQVPDPRDPRQSRATDVRLL